MEPSRPLSTPLLDRARRNPVIRPAYRQIFAAKAWSPPKPATSVPDAKAANEPSGQAVADSGADASPPAGEPVAIAVPDLTRTTAPVLVLVLAGAIAVASGANLGSLAWGTLQALGLVAPPALEAAQREQAAAISQLDQNVNGLSAALAGLSAHVYSTDSREAETTRRIGEIDAAMGLLRAGINEVRQVQNAAEEAWREPVAELKAAASRTHADMLRLRASIDEISRSREPDVTAIGARVDRIEHAMIEHNLLGGMRGSIHEHAARKPAVATAEIAPADGHIISLPPEP